MDTFNKLNIPGLYNTRIYNTIKKEYDNRTIKLEGVKLLIDNVFKRYNTTIIYGQIETSKGDYRLFEMTLDTFIDSLDRLEIMILEIHEIDSVKSDSITPSSNNRKQTSLKSYKSQSDFSGPSLMKDTSRLNVNYLSNLENELLIIGKSYNWSKHTLNNIIKSLPSKCPKCKQDYWIQDYNIVRGTNKGTIFCSCGYKLHEFIEKSISI